MIFLDGAELETDRTPSVVLVMGEVDTFASVRIIAGLTERSASLYEASSSSSSLCYCSERGRVVLLAESWTIKETTLVVEPWFSEFNVFMVWTTNRWVVGRM